MFLEFPWALTALVALPITVVIYLLRNRSKKQVVSALFLWSSPNLSANQGQRIQKVQSSWLLFLELIILTLLALAAADVHVRWLRQDPPTVLILDDSWSMQASKNQAVETIQKWVSQRRIVFPVQVVRVGKTATRDGEPCNYQADLTARLAQWSDSKMKAPECDDSTLKETIERFCSSGKPVHAVVVTDSPRSGLAQDGKVTVISVGKSNANLAFTSAVRFPSAVDGLDVVIVEIANLSAKNQTVNCQLQVESQSPRSLDSVVIPAGESSEIKASVPVDKTASLELPKDALEIDNRVVLPPLPRQTVRVRLDVSNPVLAPAVKKAVELAQDGQRKVELVSSNEDLLVTDNPTISSARVNQLQFVVPSQPLDKIDPIIYKGPYIANSSNSLMTGTDFSGVLWGVEKNDWRVEGGESSLLSVGDIPLIVQRVTTTGVSVVRLRFIPELSSLIQSPNFPIFIYNVLKQSGASIPGLRTSSVSAGEAFVFHSEQNNSEPLEILSPDNSKTSVPFRLGQAVFLPYEIGVYKIASKAKTYPASVNALNRNESDLRSLESGEWGAQFSAQQKERQFASLRVPLLLLALALAVIHQILARRSS
ncbi:MAG: BatA domain-containing protein [Thermoguttaceae bacterium]|nr:BatA domain-containing protein [Thermoguttaceae bacterium]